ncbi:MAG: serine/threonine protein kinase [Cyanobacteria bacterium HKST-UBA02]|nr:serine/threonine protein kinase [Cyanobacteria bacterium HKST-UBA02]
MQADEIVADRYKVVRRLGAGGMGSIYQAWDQVLNRDVAIKLLHPDPTPELVLRFQQEARAAASLEHRNIVRILDFGQLENGQLYLTIELVQGRSLDTILEIEGGLDPERARSILIDIAEGLEHCHRHEILHRDVKPANVMIAGEPVMNQRGSSISASPNSSSRRAGRLCPIQRPAVPWARRLS